MSGTKRAKDSELGKEIGVQIGGSLLMLVGLAVAAWLVKWQHGNILEGVYVPVLAPIIGSAVLLGIATVMIARSPNQLLSAVTCFGFSTGSIFLLYACFTHDAPWETLGAIWLGGAGWGCIFQPTLNDRFFLRLVATVSMLATYVVFFGAWLLLIPNIIYDDSNNRWHKSWGSSDHVTYHNDQDQEVTIYSGQISGSSAQTSAGHFHWYR